MAIIPTSSKKESKMDKTALFKPNQQAIPAPITIDFKFEGTTYHVDLDLEITPTLASIPCINCSKSTRQIQLSHGYEIKEKDDTKIDIINVICDESLSASPGTAAYVSVITDFGIGEINDIDSMIEVEDGSDEWNRIESHIKEKTLNHVICDGCLYHENYLGNLLEK